MYLLMKKVNRKILTEAAAGRRRPLVGRHVSILYGVWQAFSLPGPGFAGPAAFQAANAPYNHGRHGLLTPKGVKRPPLHTLALYCFNTVT